MTDDKMITETEAQAMVAAACQLTLARAKDGVFLVPAGAKAALDRLIAEAVAAERERMLHQIYEATDPGFIWGALDNVHDAETTLDDYAVAVSRAQRASFTHAQAALARLLRDARNKGLELAAALLDDLAKDERSADYAEFGNLMRSESRAKKHDARAAAIRKLKEPTE